MEIVECSELHNIFYSITFYLFSIYFNKKSFLTVNVCLKSYLALHLKITIPPWFIKGHKFESFFSESFLKNFSLNY